MKQKLCLVFITLAFMMPFSQTGNAQQQPAQGVVVKSNVFTATPGKTIKVLILGRYPKTRTRLISIPRTQGEKRQIIREIRVTPGELNRDRSGRFFTISARVDASAGIYQLQILDANKKWRSVPTNRVLIKVTALTPGISTRSLPTAQKKIPVTSKAPSKFVTQVKPSEAIGTLNKSAVERPGSISSVMQQRKVEIDTSNLNTKNVTLVQCSIANISVAGINLNFISGLNVVDVVGNAVSTISGRLDWKAYMDGNILKRNIGIEAQCNAPPGLYIVNLNQGDEPVANGNYYVTVYEKPALLPPSNQGPQDVNELTLTSDMFADASIELVASAMFSANSCGGNNADRQVVVSLFGIGYQSIQHLPRFERNLTTKEIAASFVLRGYSHSVCKARSCALGWIGPGWRGSIKQGAFVIRIPIQNFFGFRNRGMPSFPGVPCTSVDPVKWGGLGGAITDAEIPNYIHKNLAFYVSLTPTVNTQGKVSYGNVTITHSFSRSDWVGLPIESTPGTLKESILGYMDSSLALMKGELKKAFIRTETRDYLSATIMRKLNDVNSVKNISSSNNGSSLIIRY